MRRSLIDEFVNLRTWAVVGVSANPAKFGHKVYRDLRRAGYHVVAVNPHLDTVLGDQVFPNLAALPEQPDVVNLVVPPGVTEQIVQEAYQAGIQRIWMQPGAASPAAIAYCHTHGMAVIDDACAMVEKRYW
jgi:hypothetical protein